MEVVIKNNGIVLVQQAVLKFENIQWPEFINMSSGSDITIKKSGIKLPFQTKQIEYTSNVDWGHFYKLQMDANGEVEINRVIIQNYISYSQTEKYPIIIPSEEHRNLAVDMCSAFIFSLQPQQEIKLKFIQ